MGRQPAGKGVGVRESLRNSSWEGDPRVPPYHQLCGCIKVRALLFLAAGTGTARTRHVTIPRPAAAAAAPAAPVAASPDATSSAEASMSSCTRRSRSRAASSGLASCFLGSREEAPAGIQHIRVMGGGA
jgi:hypothetical protein